MIAAGDHNIAAFFFAVLDKESDLDTSELGE